MIKQKQICSYEAILFMKEIFLPFATHLRNAYITVVN